ncbi:hypothetical protein PUN28_019291 [Cardiocondyla obscurior]|uniref:Transmembrane protein n=1 Tax=Cardiocondyla obscurior TaxID=286306 RepID=A0AAW2EBL9_9HYME
MMFSKYEICILKNVKNNFLNIKFVSKNIHLLTVFSLILNILQSSVQIFLSQIFVDVRYIFT